ncbi:hypothetical protein KR032_004152 [Drosophila birchii]|nr:hypothetical protein KR032_004152 [Drosophila birchii]
MVSFCGEPGNSCSSPMAEAIMQNLMVKTSIYWEVDSAGLRTWNTGRRPDQRCLRVLREHGLRSDHFCRQFSTDDFEYFDFVVALDEAVFKELQLWANANPSRTNCELLLLTSFGRNGKPAIIHNLTPTSKQRLFRAAYYQIKECCKQLILLQKVDIVRYELPSSDDDDTYYANQTAIADGIRSTGGQATLSKMKLHHSKTEQCTQHSPPNSGEMSCCQEEGTRRKLCQKCGQKFLATL